MIRDPLALVAVIVGITALAFRLAERFGWAAKTGATLLVIAFGAVLSNLDLVAAQSPVYGMISGPVTSLAIAWLLFAVDLRSLRAAGPRMLQGFGLAVTATVAGGLVAFAVVGRFFPDAGWKLAGVMVGTYSGGGLNFVSVGRALELPESLFVAATAADNVVTALWLGATLLLPLWLVRFYPAAPASDVAESPRADDPMSRPDPMHGAAHFGVADLSVLVTAALAVVLAAELTGQLTPRVPTVIWLTTYALIGAQLPAIRRLQGSMQLGTFALHLFFAVLGIGSRVQEILVVGVEVFYFAALVVLVHGVVFLVLARAFRFDVDTTVVASQAAVGGPSTAMAMAVSRGRPDLTLPGAMAGLLGYALGTYAGLAVGWLLR
jgi:uncharacterized membrane protein